MQYKNKIFTTTDTVFDQFFYQASMVWNDSRSEERKGMEVPDYVQLCITGEDRCCGVSWAVADYVFFPCRIESLDNSPTHFFLIVFQVATNVLYIYDSLLPGGPTKAKVETHVMRYETYLPVVLERKEFQRHSQRGYRANYAKPDVVYAECAKQANGYEFSFILHVTYRLLTFFHILRMFFISYVAELLITF